MRRKFFLSIVFIWAMGILGCGAQEKSISQTEEGRNAEVSENEEGKEQQTETEQSYNTEDSTGDADKSGQNDESDSADSRVKSENGGYDESDLKDAISPIDFTYQNHPMTLMGGEKEFASGNYYTLELEKSDKEKYKELHGILDKFGTDGEKEINDFFASSTSEIQEMFSNGVEIPYMIEHDFYPVRSDSRVFSFYVSNYTFLAGAHGYTDFSGFNYDPVTGKEISFTDVVKNTDELPEIIITELIKQNEDLGEYFENLESDKLSLMESVPDRIENNARGFGWALDYDGVWLNFEDYAMGSYVAGHRSILVKFADYPDIFTDTYNNYSGEETPKITDVAKELKEAEGVSVDADSLTAGVSGDGGRDAQNSGDGGRDTQNSESESSEDYGEDWWYHAVVTNPGWSAWTADGLSTDVGKPSFELSEVSANTTDWLNEDEWSANNGIPLPKSFPYSDDTYSYSVVNDSENGTLSLMVQNDETGSLCGNYYFDEFISPPDQGQGLFADYTQPYIQYAIVKDDILYVSLGHRTYASANPHTSYLVAIDTVSGNTLWKSDDQVCGSNNFIIEGDSIICGYGFTDEPDYIYIINRINGKTQKKIKVKSAPYYFIPQDNYLYVLTYNTEYVYTLLK